MSTLQKLGVMAIVLGMLTTLVLPGRNTPQLATATFGGIKGVFSTLMGNK